MRLQRQSDGRLLSLHTAALGAGGEARIFPVPPGREYVAKIYHQPEATQAHKLAIMVAAPPDDPMASRGHISIAWPIDLLYSEEHPTRFAGYLMPRVSDARPVFHYYNPATRRRESPLFDYLYLHRAARNLAAAMRALHQRGYIVGDVNESNLLVTDTALVTLVDTDSFQVQDPGSGITYRCPVGKPDYTPPEMQGRSFLQSDRRIEHDLFGLAVLIYQLLQEGTHPFSGVYQGTDDPPPYQTRIQAGHYPYGGRRTPYLPMPFAPPQEILHPAVRQLFTRCFEDGHTAPTARPDAQTWQTVLAEAEAALIPCNANKRHFYGAHLASCPWCERTRLLGGRDPFPERATEATSVRLAGRSASGRPVGQATPIAPLSPSRSFATPTAGTAPLPGPMRTTLNVPCNRWAWGALGCAVAAILAPTSVLPLLNLLAGVGSLVCAGAAWRTASRYAGQGLWLASGAALVGAIMALTVAPSLLASTHGLQTVRVLPMLSGIRAIAFSPDGALLVSASNRAEDQRLIGGEVQEWNVETGREEETLAEYAGNASSVAFLNKGHSLLVGTDSPLESGEIDLLDAHLRGSRQVLFTVAGAPQSVAVSPDGRLAASGSLDGSVRLWDTATGLLRREWKRLGEVFVVVFAPDSRTLAVATGSPAGSVTPGTVRLLDIDADDIRWKQTAHSNATLALAYAPNGALLVSGGNDSVLRVWNSANGHLVRTLPMSTLRVSSLAFSPDGALLASACLRQEGTTFHHEIVLWDTRTWQPIRTLTGHRDRITTLAFAPDGRTLASGSLDATLCLWHIR